MAKVCVRGKFFFIERVNTDKDLGTFIHVGYERLCADNRYECSEHKHVTSRSVIYV
jgi:hypothetical protein